MPLSGFELTTQWSSTLPLDYGAHPIWPIIITHMYTIITWLLHNDYILVKQVNITYGYQSHAIKHTHIRTPACTGQSWSLRMNKVNDLFNIHIVVPCQASVSWLLNVTEEEEPMWQMFDYEFLDPVRLFCLIVNISGIEIVKYIVFQYKTVKIQHQIAIPWCIYQLTHELYAPE